MQQQNRQAAIQFTLFDLAHALDLFCDMLDVGIFQFTGAQKLCLFVGPGEVITLVEARSHFRFLRRFRSW